MAFDSQATSQKLAREAKIGLTVVAYGTSSPELAVGLPLFQKPDRPDQQSAGDERDHHRAHDEEDEELHEAFTVTEHGAHSRHGPGCGYHRPMDPLRDGAKFLSRGMRGGNGLLTFVGALLVARGVVVVER